jgi:hypothetical protein
MPDQNTQLIEQLRDELLKRARAIVEYESGQPYGATQEGPEGPQAKAPKEKNYLHNACSKLKEWLQTRLSKNRRFKMRFHHHLDLYEQMARFAERADDAGGKISTDHAALMKLHKTSGLRQQAMDARMEALEVRFGELSGPSLIAVLSKEIADLRARIEVLEKK